MPWTDGGVVGYLLATPQPPLPPSPPPPGSSVAWRVGLALGLGEEEEGPGEGSRGVVTPKEFRLPPFENDLDDNDDSRALRSLELSLEWRNEAGWGNRKRAEIVRGKLPDHNRNFLSGAVGGTADLN